MRADRLAARQFPGTRRKAEWFGRQRADRAQVDDITGQFRINRSIDEGENLRTLAAVHHAEFHDSGNFLAEPHAARAVNAARHVGRDQRTEILVDDDSLLFLIARGTAAIADRQILQLALAALIADRTIERMIDQQKLHHALLRLDRLLGTRLDLHAVRHGRGAGRQWLGRLFHFDQAHAAVGRNRELLVVAEVRDIGTDLVGSVHHRAAFGHLNLFTVDFQF